MTKPSKFSRPQREPTPAEIEHVIAQAETRDEPATVAVPPEAEVRFTMVLPSGMSEKVDKARKGAGGMARLAWIRLAIAEKLNRDGV
ncbi:MAG: hypothetical protein E7K72_16560 [Roseomonas mucosa]|uniref:hypothetical protein n=1 Tax=Roseomonas mucosa TaxID=207340 RepID=UPI0028CBF1C9|nr:hypothetical protein [Roseomonas mucosa]MDT8278140.1 hypothetical protein [Roseomonas mucosa]MDU7522975.1 hypothetical protein [Roseomonas mucosa]